MGAGMNDYSDYQQRQRRAVNAVISKIFNGDPRDPITKQLRRMTGLEKQGKGESSEEGHRKPTNGDNKP